MSLFINSIQFNTPLLSTLVLSIVNTYKKILTHTEPKLAKQNKWNLMKFGEKFWAKLCLNLQL